ncbi:hypothetical protein LCGC14_0569410 [marine sediment metagenome]|uniref:Helicase C-terminal domain-containing protein n=1 Tax=marine sediment metagenome TaxID=412755 RepID=A0A0F9S379_9ZZZZ
MKFKRSNQDYTAFLKTKAISDNPSGFDVDLDDLNQMLFDWQKVLVKWSLYKGRSALFEDCGLGKTPQQLAWSDTVHQKTDGDILILAPLAVSIQTQKEGEKFGVDVNVCKTQDGMKQGINITNYERLHHFDQADIAGIVLDESSILKNFAGMIRNQIIDQFISVPFKLCCTATPAPNDYMELGNHSEFLGVMTRTEMLAMFFINDSGEAGKWRLKGHVKDNLFWKWLSSWAVMLSMPSDLGYENGGFELPEIKYHECIIPTTAKPKRGLFVDEVQTLNERRQVRKETIDIRTRLAGNIINQTDDRFVIWCNLNDESAALTECIDSAIEVAGRHDNDIKSKRMLDFASGQIRRIVTKPKVAGLGMNWQICHNAIFVGLSDSWEQLYQAVRRIWRYGQVEEVNIYIIIESREGAVLKNIKRKDRQAKEMIENMITHTKELTKRELAQTTKDITDYVPQITMEVPAWLQSLQP